MVPTPSRWRRVFHWVFGVMASITVASLFIGVAALQSHNTDLLTLMVLITTLDAFLSLFLYSIIAFRWTPKQRIWLSFYFGIISFSDGLLVVLALRSLQR